MSNHNKNSIIAIGAKIRTIIAISMTCIITLFSSLYFGDRALNTFDNAMVKIYQFLNYPLDIISKQIHVLYESIDNHYKIDQLIEENKQLRSINLEIDIIKKENLELRNINNYIAPLSFRYITTQVVSYRFDQFGMKLMLNTGSDNGIAEGDIVMNSEGIIGKVHRVSDHSSNITLWSNTNFKVPVLLLESGIRCIAKGTQSNNFMELVYLPEDIYPITGEIAVTSGEGGSIPFGIKVGNVSSHSIYDDTTLLTPASRIELINTVAIATSSRTDFKQPALD